MISAKILGSAVAALVMGSAALAQPSGEIGYEKDALGYEALVAGDNELALQQLQASERDYAKDPARLINLGQAYARLGRMGDAARMFMAALNSDRSFDLVLANGEVIDSRDAAGLALQNLNERIARR